MHHCYSLLTLVGSADKAQDPGFRQRYLEIHRQFIRTGDPGLPAGVLNEVGANVSVNPLRERRCEFWRDAAVLEQYAWDELRAVLV